MFIQLTSKNGKTVLVNVRNASHIYPVENEGKFSTVVYFDDENLVTVKESLEQVTQLIRQSGGGI